MERIEITQLGNADFSNPMVFDANAMLEEERKDSYDKFRAAVDDIKTLRKEFITVCAVSFGKDSTVVLLAALNAHLELMDEGVLDSSSPFVVSHINTGVENHLMEMLCEEAMSSLRAFCKQQGIHLELKVGRPLLSKNWSSLFLSGIKIISSARANNDCAEIMKIDNARRLERSIESQYQGKVVTLLGSRMSESVRREANTRRRGTDKVTALDLISGTSEAERVFAPIMSMTDDDVWNLIRMAGDTPIVQSGFSIISFQANHRLIDIIYRDSKDGACQYSAKKVKGTKERAGGCGGSARTGCYTCAKGITDKSGEEQVKKPRHAAISGNMLKVRNYIMYVAQDIKYRTYQGKAIDHTTGAVALQPNTLRADVIDKLIWLMSQVTVDDQIRAQRFSNLVAQGREMEDAGYRDIITDTTLSDDDRQTLADVYKKHAQRHLIRPMSLDIAIYLSAIHARDGVRLPPHRAVWIWKQVCEGARIPYPDVDPRDGIISDIPDAVMAIPESNVPYPSMHEFDFLSSTDAQGCELDSTQFQLRMPVRDAKYFLTGDDKQYVKGLSNTDTITVQGIGQSTWTHKLRLNPLDNAPALKFSKRPVKKVSRKNGGFKVTERGRTSLDSPSFSLRANTPNLAENLLVDIPLYYHEANRQEQLGIDADVDALTGYDIDREGIENWLQFGGFESAMDAHDKAVAVRERHDKSIYFYGGVGAFQHYARYGVLALNKSAISNTKRILQRTSYFNRLGLFALDDDAICALSKRTAKEDSLIISDFCNTQRNQDLPLKAILAMSEYRDYKASVLRGIRKARNQKRAQLKKQHQAVLDGLKDRDCSFAVAHLHEMKARILSQYQHAFEGLTYAKTLVDNGIHGFDGSDYRQIIKIQQGVINYIRAFFTDEAMMLRLFDNGLHDTLFNDAFNRIRLLKAGEAIIGELNDLEADTYLTLSERVQNSAAFTTKEDILIHNNMIHQLTDVRHKSTPLAAQKALNLKASVSATQLVW